MSDQNAQPQANAGQSATQTPNFAQTSQGIAPEQPQKIPGQHTPVIAQGVDLTAWYADKRAEIKNDFAEKNEKFFTETFGTADISEIKNLAKTVNAVRGNNKPAAAIEDLMKQIQDNTGKISQLETYKQEQALENKMLRQIKNAKDVDLAIYAMRSRFDWREKDGTLQAFVKGSEIPVVNNETGKQKTFTDILSDLEKDPNTSGLFYSAPSPLKQPNDRQTLGNATPGTKQGFGYPSASDRANPRFLAAVKSTNQWFDLMAGKEINISMAYARM